VKAVNETTYAVKAFLTARLLRAAAIVVSSLLAAPAALHAQSAPLAHIASAGAGASLDRAGSRVSPLKAGVILKPGDVIDTTGGGRVAISLSDRSYVIVFPGSRVAVRDFYSAGSMRDLLDVALGRVRVKIHRLGKRPNPYRVTSPAATIAVRGTEFLVDVEPSGQTQVSVYEGLVEVSSRFDPQQKRLVGPGRSVVVRPSGDISLNLPGPGGELEAQVKPLSDQKNFYHRDPEYAVIFSFNVYNRAVTEKTFNNLPSRFTAFSDAHFDSFLNPAYATEFKRASGRLYLLPSLSEPFEHIRASFPAGRSQAASAHPFDYSLSMQSSYFTPVTPRWVIGGGISTARTQLESSAFSETRSEWAGYTRTYKFDGSVAADTANVSLIAARSFGARERSSLGFKLERLESRAELQTAEEVKEDLDIYPEPFVSRRFNDARARSHRTTAALGFAHDFSRGDKLGVTYSYGAAGGGFAYHTDNQLFPFGNTVMAKEIATNASEVAVTLRGPVTRRLFYGLEGSWLTERITDDYQFKKSVLTERRDSGRPRIGGGIGFALRPRTIFSFDLSLAGKSVKEETVEISPDEIYRNRQRYNATFINGHLGLQTDLGRRFIASASALRVYERRYFELFDYHENQQHTFSSFSLGWRIRPDFLAQYFISTDYGRRGPSHTVVLRYDFSFGGDN